ncbi:major facilitator superfamily domain-containing protein [Hysterangium stoloniferum]|nr:major facilitator superfamily domain-containing protein [Hysterangium stoloniferum]
MSANEHTPLLRDNADTNGTTTSTVDRPGPLEISAANRRSILVGVWMATFLSVRQFFFPLFVSSISSEYNQSNQASWLGTSYLLATCAFTPLYGRLSDAIGRRGANQIAVFFAGFGALCCGLSNSLEMLIVARFLSGIGGGGVFTTATVITSDMFSMRGRSLMQGIAGVFTGVGMGLGGPLGGWISDRFGWRWAFLIQVPVWVTSLVLTQYNLRYVMVIPGRGKNITDGLKRIDYGGCLTILLSVGSLLFFLSYKYNDDLPFNSPSVIIALVICIVTFIAFVLTELLVASEPILAPFLVRQKAPMLLGLSTSLAGICGFSVMYFVPMFFETVMLTSVSTAGAHLLPNSIAVSLGSLFAGWIISSTGRYRIVDLFGIGPVLATTLLMFLNENSGMFIQWLIIVPIGFGLGVMYQTGLMAILIHVDPSATAVAAGFIQLWRGIGQVCGVAFASAVFQSMLGQELTKRISGPDAADIISQIRHSSRLVATLPPDLQQQAQMSYKIALRGVFALSACSSFLAFLFRFAIPEKSLDGEGVRDAPPKLVTHGDVEQQPQQPPTGSCAVADHDKQADSAGTKSCSTRSISRRLSTYEPTEGRVDVENEMAGPTRWWMMSA